MADLSPKQYKAICMLVAGYEINEVAQAIGLTRVVVSRWKKEAKFQAQLDEAIFKVYDSAIAELIAGADYAAKELIKIIQDEETPVKVRVNAIQTLLSFATKAKDNYIRKTSDSYVDVNINGASYE